MSYVGVIYSKTMVFPTQPTVVLFIVTLVILGSSMVDASYSRWGKSNNNVIAAQTTM